MVWISRQQERTKMKILDRLNCVSFAIFEQKASSLTWSKFATNYHHSPFLQMPTPGLNRSAPSSLISNPVTNSNNNVQAQQQCTFHPSRFPIQNQKLRHCDRQKYYRRLVKLKIYVLGRKINRIYPNSSVCPWTIPELPGTELQTKRFGWMSRWWCQAPDSFYVWELTRWQ